MKSVNGATPLALLTPTKSFIESGTRIICTKTAIEGRFIGSNPDLSGIARIRTVPLLPKMPFPL